MLLADNYILSLIMYIILYTQQYIVNGFMFVVHIQLLSHKHKNNYIHRYRHGIGGFSYRINELRPIQFTRSYLTRIYASDIR